MVRGTLLHKPLGQQGETVDPFARPIGYLQNACRLARGFVIVYNIESLQTGNPKSRSWLVSGLSVVAEDNGAGDGWEDALMDARDALVFQSRAMTLASRLAMHV